MKQNTGLSTKQARELLHRFGQNVLNQKKPTPLLYVFLSQFNNLLIFLLIVASFASLLLGDYLDGLFILIIVILNGFFGFIQEYKAEKAISALKKMTVPTTRIIRDGVEQKIESSLLVPGDVIVLDEGDKISADCTLIESYHLAVNEAPLTGESLSIEKDFEQDDKNKVFLGTIVVRGRGKAIVTHTGMQTQFGKIASSLSEIKNEETPLQKKLATLGKQLSILAVIASIVVFIIGFISGNPLFEMIFTSISLAVAAVPEGLPAVITITLAIGMQRMARKKAILRKLASIEALGSVSVIATDKTGTITKNEMRVQEIWTINNSAQSKELLIHASVICNNASLVETDKPEIFDILGDTTEGSLLLYAQEYNHSVSEIKQNGKLLEEFSFDPHLKLMTVVWENKDGKYIYTKGAPESILEKCTVSEQERKKIIQEYEKYAGSGLRIIALAYRNSTTTPKTRESAESNLTFVGLFGIADPVRDEVKDAIITAKEAGIKTIMITGDNALTARAVGLQIGLIEHNDEIITGEQFEELSDIDALKRLDSISIFARTTPKQKLRIVQLLQNKGNIVAVTGDGVNDALALKQANVGVAMGITGTDVAKEASAMILSDDNYASLVTAIEEGRIIFDNIKKSTKYLVGCNIGEVLAVFLGILFGLPLILTPLQLLYINLVTDGLPAIALSVSPKHENVMKRKPRSDNGIFDKPDKTWLLEVSFLTAIITIVSFYIGYRSDGLMLGRTYSFTALVLVQPFILLDLWARNRSIFQRKIITNKIFVSAFFIPIILQFVIIFTPVFSTIFKITHISFVSIIFLVMMSSLVLISSELRKKFFVTVTV